MPQQHTNKSIESLQQEKDKIKSRLYQINPTAHTTRLEVQELVLRWAYILDELRVIAPEQFKYPQSVIFSTITNELRKDGMNSTMQDWVYRSFESPEYNKWKTGYYSSSRITPPPQVEEQELIGEKHAINAQALHAISYMESNPNQELVKQYNKRQFELRLKQQVVQKKQIEEKNRETIPKPDWLPPGQDGQESLLWVAMCKHIKVMQHNALHIWTYPPQDPKDDAWYAEGIDLLTAMFVPGSDLKYVRDLLSWMEIVYESITQSKHSAMSHSKILTSSNKYRKVTREQIGDVTPLFLYLAIRLLTGIRAVAAISEYLRKYQKPFIGTFHDNRHSKLSESSFGNAQFLDTDQVVTP